MTSEIWNRVIDPCRTFVIAEAGVNHNGELALAQELVMAAKKSGADLVKFQIFQPELLASSEAGQAEYQARNCGTRPQLEMIKEWELDESELQQLADFCRFTGIAFTASPFDLASVDALDRLGVPFIKIPSGEITHPQLLARIGRLHRPVVLSTGMADLSEVREAVSCLKTSGTRDLVLLQCTSCYPTCMEDVNLRAMLTMKKEWELPVGFSDHTLGIDAVLAAVALGAVVIEKHLTLDRTMKGPDHAASLEPAEFAEMVRRIRNIELALGSGEKKPAAAEADVARVARRSLVAANVIPRGTIIEEKHIAIKRPGTGLAPSDLARVVGMRARIEIPADRILAWEMFE